MFLLHIFEARNIATSVPSIVPLERTFLFSSFLSLIVNVKMKTNFVKYINNQDIKSHFCQEK